MLQCVRAETERACQTDSSKFATAFSRKMWAKVDPNPDLNSDSLIAQVLDSIGEHQPPHGQQTAPAR